MTPLRASVPAPCLGVAGVLAVLLSPQQIIARGTDWRFLNELKLELKA